MLEVGGKFQKYNEIMNDKRAKEILKFNAHYYLRERRVMGCHWEEWQAVEHMLKRWEDNDMKLRATRRGLRSILAKLSCGWKGSYLSEIYQILKKSYP